MSRIGRLPIVVPAGVDVKIDGSTVSVKGPKGTLTGTYNSKMAIELKDGHINGEFQRDPALSEEDLIAKMV